MKINIHNNTIEAADKTINAFISNLNKPTSKDRLKTQNIKCGFALQGACCRSCANGPCTITVDSPLGVCGADANLIASRNFLRSMTVGSSSYLHILEILARELIKIGEMKDLIKGQAALKRLSNAFGIKEENNHKKLIIIGNLILEDLYGSGEYSLQLLERMVYKPRYNNWKKNNLLPGGLKTELLNSLSKTSSNLNTDLNDLLRDIYKQGIITGVYGLTLISFLNDIIIGDPQIHLANNGLNLVDKDYINIVVTGCQPHLLNDLDTYLDSLEVKRFVEKTPAKGFKIIGLSSLGSELEYRSIHYKKTFAGNAGNNSVAEALLYTGAIDLIISDFSANIPTIQDLAQKLNIKMFSLDKLSKKPLSRNLNTSYEYRRRLSQEIAQEGITSYLARRQDSQIELLEGHGFKNNLAGFTESNLKEHLKGNFTPVCNNMSQDNIKGIVLLTGYSNLVDGGEDRFTVDLVQRLLDEDILVISAGGPSASLANLGFTNQEANLRMGVKLRKFCNDLNIPAVINFGSNLSLGRAVLLFTEIASIFDVDLGDLPIVVSSPEWLTEKSLAEAIFFVSLGLPLHIGKPFEITSSDFLMDNLTDGLNSITGGKLIMNENPAETIRIFKDIFKRKLEALGL